MPADLSPLQGLAWVVSRLVHAYSIVVLVAVVMSWIRVNPANPVARIVHTLTEPPLRFLRKALPFLVVGGLDLSPIVLLIGLQMLANGISRLAYSVA